jgi:hypothetical protein
LRLGVSECYLARRELFYGHKLFSKARKTVKNWPFQIAFYGNSSVDDQRIILDELSYYLHQIDNANDFVFLDGFAKVVLPGEKGGNRAYIEAVNPYQTFQFQVLNFRFIMN